MGPGVRRLEPWVLSDPVSTGHVFLSVAHRRPFIRIIIALSRRFPRSMYILPAIDAKPHLLRLVLVFF